ncbi:MlaA family lipoprotein [Thalassotalea sp. PLHSN55]|uniref:MlaA family lipoprotein n=1 Tax=Thalassotalea sp. PLHSN55 TaxID=3435888 RepID=UPI003F83CEBF
MFNYFKANRSLRLLQVILFSAILSACATTNSPEATDAETAQNTYADPRDPLEPLNRKLWTFTWDYTDKYITRPVSLFYGNVMPEFLREGLYNVATNLNGPSTIINQLLLLQFDNAAKSTGRFLLNTTIGLAGFYDPASDFGWAKNEKEFGEVLGKYGVSDGPYFIIPGIKPTSVREEVGDYVDKYYWPYTLLGFWPSFTRWAIEGMETRIQLVEQEELLNEAIDPYEFVKNAYFQNMEYKVWDGNPPLKVDEEEEADFDAFLDEFDDYQDELDEASAEPEPEPELKGEQQAPQSEQID